MTCVVAGCTNRVKARGWCPTHYHRWWVTREDPDQGPGLRSLRLPVAPLESYMVVRGFPMGPWAGWNEHPPASVNQWPEALQQGFARARRDRFLSVEMADRIAVHLKVHPVCIWGWDFYVGIVGDVEVPA